MPTEQKNKVTYGIQNVYFAEVTADAEGTYTCGAPTAFPGAQKISMEPQGDMIKVSADNMEYYTAPNNQGYSATLTMTEAVEKFMIDHLGEELVATDKVLTEKQGATQKNFALLFQFEGDAKAVRHVIYNCVAGRAKVESETTTDGGVTTNVTEIPITMKPRKKDRAIKTRTTEATTADIYDVWFEKVYGTDKVGV